MLDENQIISLTGEEEKVTERLAKVREILSEKFDDRLGEDDMGDLERAMEDLRYWTPS